jgi:hypothetical protein
VGGLEIDQWYVKRNKTEKEKGGGDRRVRCLFLLSLGTFSRAGSGHSGKGREDVGLRVDTRMRAED